MLVMRKVSVFSLFIKEKTGIPCYGEIRHIVEDDINRERYMVFAFLDNKEKILIRGYLGNYNDSPLLYTVSKKTEKRILELINVFIIQLRKED